MKTYSDVPLASSNGLSEKSVISIFEDKDKVLWIGTDGGGIDRFDLITSRFTHFPNTYKEKVNSIYELNPKELLLSVFGKGLYRFNKKSGNMTPFPIIDKRVNGSIYSMGLPIVIQPGKGHICYFIGAGLYTLDSLTGKIQYIPNPYPNTWMQPFYHSEEYSYLWADKSIFRLNHKTHSLEVVWSTKDDNKLTSACFDRRNTLYIGSENGIIVYNMKTKNQKKIFTLHFTAITSLLWEQNNRIWIGAKNKIFAYNPQEDQFSMFGNSDGVLPNELFSRPVLIASTGDIYMGGNMGLLHINGKNISLNFSLPQLFLSRIEKNGELFEIQDLTNKVFTLPWNFGNIQFYFSVKEKNFFRERRFRYTITGNLSSVIESDKSNLLLHSLPAGEYTVSVQCDTQNGEWTPPIVYAQLIITPPWWKSMWAVGIYILIAIAIVWLFALYYIRKKKRQLRKEMKIHQQKVNEEKIQFLININHELRTPLTLIYSPLKRHFEQQPDMQKNDLLRGIFRQAQRMKEIINMVLDVRKMEVGKGTVQLRTCELNQWITTLADDFKPEFDAKEIKLVLELDSQINQFILDTDKTEKAINNLLMNALKFSNSHTEIKITTLLAEKGLRITIADQGIGLDDHVGRLFRQFYQGEHNRGGSGIGLSYSKMIIEMQGGNIQAFNNPDGGATFVIELPYRSQANTIVCESKPYINELLSFEQIVNIESEMFSLQKYSVLIVEDDPELRLFLKQFLEEKFNKVYIAENGKIGYQLVISCLPDVVISDVMMPVKDGYELCKQIKANLECSHVPVILLTAKEDNQSIVTGYQTGADIYLPKPFDPSILLSMIRTQIKNRENIKEKYRSSICDTLLPQESFFSNIDEHFLEKLNKLMNDHLDNPKLDVNFLAREIGMSRTSLYNKINQLIGLNVGEYIDKQRLIKAEQLVKNTNMTMQEVAEKTGFSTQRYFSKVFKDTYGVPPSKYRTDNQNENSLVG